MSESEVPSEVNVESVSLEESLVLSDVLLELEAPELVLTEDADVLLLEVPEEALLVDGSAVVGAPFSATVVVSLLHEVLPLEPKDDPVELLVDVPELELTT
jgi:hypothetical protein